MLTTRLTPEATSKLATSFAVIETRGWRIPYPSVTRRTAFWSILSVVLIRENFREYLDHLLHDGYSGRHDEHGSDPDLIDPGGNLAYGELYLAITRHFPPRQLSAILASHADPDIVASLDRWTSATDARMRA